MSQKLAVNGFRWKENINKFDEDFIKNYDEGSEKGYILGVDIDYPKELHDLHSDLSFFPGRIKNNKGNKFVCNLYDKNDYVVHMTALKKALSEFDIEKCIE